MKSKIIVILLLFFSTFAPSQISIQGVVIVASTDQPIPYVNIGIQKKGLGTVSDFDGTYTLRAESYQDLVMFSSIGYEVSTISVEQLLKDADVELMPIEYTLHQVEITASKLEGKEEIFGVKNKKRGLSIGFGSRQLGTEVGALIHIKEPTYVKSANFVLNHTKGDSLLFRVNIYDYQENQLGEKILKEDLFLKTKQRKGVISIDLTSYDLVLERDVLLSLEWIKDDDGQGNADITFDTKKSRKLRGVHIKNTSLGDFELMGHINSKLKPCFYFVGKRLNK
ncbi:MAG: carboxypeptidase-like regulatory domain-containing protein [Bacteroidota bacterium]